MLILYFYKHFLIQVHTIFSNNHRYGKESHKAVLLDKSPNYLKFWTIRNEIVIAWSQD